MKAPRSYNDVAVDIFLSTMTASFMLPTLKLTKCFNNP